MNAISQMTAALKEGIKRVEEGLSTLTPRQCMRVQEAVQAHTVCHLIEIACSGQSLSAPHCLRLRKLAQLSGGSITQDLAQALQEWKNAPAYFLEAAHNAARYHKNGLEGPAKEVYAQMIDLLACPELLYS